jgi:hypothetical protein
MFSFLAATSQLLVEAARSQLLVEAAKNTVSMHICTDV